MEKEALSESRRKFLKSVLPASAMICIGCPTALSMDIERGMNQEQDFDSKIKTEFSISYEEYFDVEFDHFIGTMERFANYMGRDNLIDMLKRSTDDRYRLRKPNTEANSVKDYVNYFLKSEFFKHAHDREVLELTDHVCEVKVTNCLWAKTFRSKNAGDIGYANSCYGDFAGATAFNPKLRLERTKTLMQGHDCCNFRYTWES